MRALYQLVEDCFWEPTRLWDSCREECYMIAGVLPLLYSDFSKGWNTTVHSIDSSLYGWGVCCSCTRDVREVAEAGRWNERWRYKRLPPEEWAPRRRVGLDPEVAEFARTLESVVIETVESGKMTKDLAALVGKDQAWQSTEEFMASLAENLRIKMA